MHIVSRSEPEGGQITYEYQYELHLYQNEQIHGQFTNKELEPNVTRNWSLKTPVPPGKASSAPRGWGVKWRYYRGTRLTGKLT